jgi:membrane protease YdiL (CAAX protease family)
MSLFSSTSPFLLAFIQGAVKGFLAGPKATLQADAETSILGAPVWEEALYRWAPNAAADAVDAKIPTGWTAAAFALDHVAAEAKDSTSSQLAFRFADVFVGGLIYENAFKAHGLLGAIGAHALHNLTTVFTAKAVGARTAPAHFAGRRKRPAKSVRRVVKRSTNRRK